MRNIVAKRGRPAAVSPGRRSTLVRRIIATRTAAGLTQQQVAERAGLTLSQIGDIEADRWKSPRLDTLRKLAMGLGVSVAEIVA